MDTSGEGTVKFIRRELEQLGKQGLPMLLATGESDADVFRAYSNSTVGPGGAVTIEVGPRPESVEWDIYQIAVQTTSPSDVCTAEIHHNGYFLCGTSLGSKDCATGPPDLVAVPHDIVTIMWYNVNPGDMCQAGVWYNENPTGSTYSTAH